MSRARTRNLGTVVSTMQEDIHRARADMTDPTSWRRTHTLDFASGTLVPRTDGSTPPVLTRLQANRVGDNVEFYAPALATGGSSPFGPSSMDTMGYMADQIGLWESFDNNFDGRMNMRKSIRWWERDELVFKCIRVLCQLANSMITWESPEDDVKAFFENWFEQAIPASFRKQFFLEYYRSGMVPIFKTLIDYKPRDFKDNKAPSLVGNNVQARATREEIAANEVYTKAVAAKSDEIITRTKADYENYRTALGEYEQAKASRRLPGDTLKAMAKDVVMKQYKWRKNQLPGKYTILNPLRVEMDGPADMAWLQQPFFNIDPLVASAVMSPAPMQRELVDAMPAEIVFQIRQGNQRVWLAPNVCKIVFGDKQDYERYPTPIATHAFPALEMKQELYQMDMSTIRGVKNRILLVKVGDKDYPALDGGQIAAAQKVFNQPARNMTFFWNHAISLEWIEPTLDSLKDQAKYQKWDSAIRTVFGISAVLTGTSETAGAIGNSVMNFKGVEEEVNEAQEAFLEWLHAEVRMIKAALGISAPVTAKFDKLNLKDEVKFMAVIMQMVMNGILDHETALETMRFHFPTIVNRMKKMKPLKEKGLFVPQPSANNMGPSGEMKPQGGAGAKGGISTGGKPAAQPGAKNNSDRTGQSTPKKAKARLVRIENEDALVVDSGDEALDNDQLVQLSERFGIASANIWSREKYEEAHGSISFIEPAPELTMAETTIALREAMDLDFRVNEETDKAIAAMKGDKPEGKRGKYATKEQKSKIRSVARDKVLQAYAAEKVGELPDAWQEVLQEVSVQFEESELDLQGIGVDLDVYAWALCTHRIKKAKAAKAN